MTLIDTEMAATMLRCSARHVRALVARGVLLNHGTAKRVLLSLESLTDAIRRGEVKPEPTRGRPKM
jgi:argininosuccinate lyase